MIARVRKRKKKYGLNYKCHNVNVVQVKCVSQKKDKKAEKEECDEEEPEYADKWLWWTDPLEELSEIEDAFKVDGEIKLGEKTILDVGTDCVKPLYIALKFKPKKIIGIADELPDFWSDLEAKSKLFTNTKVSFYYCNFFDKETFEKVLKKEGILKEGKIEKFDIVLLSKTLHHLRTGECIAHKRKKHGQKHRHREDEKCCIYDFEAQEIFKSLLEYGERVIVYEYFRPYERDDDKVRGRGGYFTTQEWREIFRHLLAKNNTKKYEVKFINPRKGDLHNVLRNKKKELVIRNDKEEVKLDKMLRQVDCICFCIEHQKKKKEM